MPGRPTFGHAVLLAGWLAVAGCGYEPGLPACAVEAQAKVTGDWLLTATGSREACGNDRLNGELSLRTEAPFRVTAESVTTPEMHSRLYLSEPPPGVSFAGEVTGGCVHFRIREQGPEAANYAFEGRMEDRHVARKKLAGTFSGNGPDGCRSRGDFGVRIR